MKTPFHARLSITSGEPAGIGPDLCVQLSQHNIDSQLIVLGDPLLMEQRAQQLNIPLELKLLNSIDSSCDNQSAGTLNVFPVQLDGPVQPGKLDRRNANYVLKMLELATQACIEQKCHAMVTGPLHKGIINDAGINFTGHTEYLAQLTHAPLPVMMLQTQGLRVALVTTHIPLRDVADAITQQRLEKVLAILHGDLVNKYGIADPQIYVCGLNPHAGEGGHLGGEEQKIIEPVLDRMREQGMSIHGPLSADTIFSPSNLQKADVFLAMYHDQGLPVLKYKGFGLAINITLGLPVIRTSVDHGTALELAGTGKANSSSFLLAIQSAAELAEHIN